MAKPAVQNSCGPARGTRSEIILLKDYYLVPCGREMLRDGTTIYATTHDRYIKLLLVQLGHSLLHVNTFQYFQFGMNFQYGKPRPQDIAAIRFLFSNL